MKEVSHVLLSWASKTHIESVLFRASAFTGAKLASGVPAVKRVQFCSFELSLGAGPPLARSILKRAKKQHRDLQLPCGCYIASETDSISTLPIRDYAWTEQQFVQLVSTFADVYFKPGMCVCGGGGGSGSLTFACYRGSAAALISPPPHQKKKR